MRPAGTDLVLDLGTANVRILTRAHGLVLNEPSVVAVAADGTVVAAGRRALTVARHDEVGLHRPLRGGLVADPDAAAAMVRLLLAEVDRRWPIGNPAVVVCVPSDITAAERCAFQDVAVAAGARAGFVIEDPIAAAIGSGLPIADELPILLVDAGAGTTDVAVLRGGGIEVSRSVPLGGDDIDAAIVDLLRHGHGLRVTSRAAERIKLTLPELLAGPDGLRAQIAAQGRDADSGAPVAALVTVAEILRAAGPVVAGIVDVVRATLDRADPHCAADLLGSAAWLTGGTALLPRLDAAIAAGTGLHVRISEDPMHRVAAGARACMESADDLAAIFVAHA